MSSPTSPPSQPAPSSLSMPGDGDALRAIVAAIPDLMIRLDAADAVVECKIGVAFERLLAPALTSGSRAAELAASHVSADFRAAAAQARQSGELMVIEYALPDGPRRSHYEARLAPAGRGEVVAFVRDITGRKRAEEELFQSREMLRKVIDTIPQRVFWKNRNSIYLGCNRPMALDCGFADPAGIIGKDDFETDSAAIAELYRADDQEVMRTDRPKLDYVEPQECSDGRRKWLRTSKAPLHDAAGNVIGILGCYEDVTERMQAERLRAGQTRILEMTVAGAPLAETLTRVAELMESLAEGVRCSILLVDPDGKRLRWCVAPTLPAEFAARVDGLPIAEGNGSCGTAAARADRVITTDTATDPLWASAREFAAQHGVAACWSQPILSSQRGVLGTFALYWRTPRAPNAIESECMSIAAHLAGIAIQRKRAEDAQRTAEEKYRNIFEHALDGIFQITPEGRIVEANPAFARMFGYDSPAALMSAVRDVAQALCVQPERYAEFTRALQARGLVQRWELAMQDRSKRLLWVLLDARLAQAADGQTLCYEGIARDITERKRLEQQFLQSQKMEAFGQLAGGVAHDFNNLLTIILGNLSLLRLGGMDAPLEHNAVEDCFRAAQRAANLTGQLLTFSRRQPIEPHDLDLNEVVQHMSSLLQRIIGEHIKLHTRCAAGGARVRADAGMLEQVLMNLVLNSRDAMPGGGTLEIATTAVDLDAAAAWSMPRARPGSFVRLTIADTGTGIEPEHLPHIFEPFYTTKEVGKGTGLGLATVFGIVEQHEGWIDVASTPGTGTTIHVYLPRLVDGVDAIAISTASGLPRGGTEAILLVEDEADVRALMCTLLQRHGYDVHAAANGVEALALWRERRGQFALLVTDMVMPGGVNGRQLAQQLLAEKPGLRVIYCSGYTDDMLGGDGAARGKPNFLEKPFDLHVFLARVRASLDAR